MTRTLQAAFFCFFSLRYFIKKNAACHRKTEICGADHAGFGNDQPNLDIQFLVQLL